MFQYTRVRGTGCVGKRIPAISPFNFGIDEMWLKTVQANMKVAPITKAGGWGNECGIRKNGISGRYAERGKERTRGDLGRYRQAQAGRGRTVTLGEIIELQQGDPGGLEDVVGRRRAVRDRCWARGIVAGLGGILPKRRVEGIGEDVVGDASDETPQLAVGLRRAFVRGQPASGIGDSGGSGGFCYLDSEEARGGQLRRLGSRWLQRFRRRECRSRVELAGCGRLRLDMAPPDLWCQFDDGAKSSPCQATSIRISEARL
ncbi:hypothetical protein GGX14DRAFT_392909 [Mycena pura]|uniref:Uncharacterized protein n=1 Tax=Mycena pura TaxID=153505 RepID=A0AAD6VHR7_9AGAR|nr:hypothetical protein GGX14DRAFT_392909 [Mycena pura]